MLFKWYISRCLNKGYEVGEACKAYDKLKDRICGYAFFGLLVTLITVLII